jgi:exodeoxyribonuclease V alpha subunit
MPVMFLKNTKRGTKNGQILKLLAYDHEKRIFTFEHGIQATMDESVYLFMPGYCLTVHKSQGSEYDYVALVLDNVESLLTSEIAYTAVTRAKKDIKLFKLKDVNEKLLYKTPK